MSTLRISFYQRGVLEKIRLDADLNGTAWPTCSITTRRSLMRKGLIDGTCRGYTITDAGRIALEPVLKTCACGKTYTKTTWKLLDFVGHWDDSEPANPEHPEYGEPQGLLEQRNCVCGSTIMLPCSELEAQCT